jgi:ABC-type transport system involved in cytochrome c biogenesis permease subunit
MAAEEKAVAAEEMAVFLFLALLLVALLLRLFWLWLWLWHQRKRRRRLRKRQRQQRKALAPEELVAEVGAMLLLFACIDGVVGPKQQHLNHN